MGNMQFQNLWNVYRQEERGEDQGEDQRHQSAYNRRLRAMQSPN